MRDGGDPISGLYDLVRQSVRVCGVARVIAYDPARQTADVELQTQEERALSTGRASVPTIVVEGCPVFWPGGASRLLTMGLRADDMVLALYRHRSHDEIDSGEAGPVVPASTRRMNPSDVVILPGYVAPAKGVDPSMYREDGQPVLSMPDGEALHVGTSGASFTLARSGLTEARLSLIADALDTAADAAAAAAATTPGDGGAGAFGAFKTSLAATLLGFPVSVASPRIKVDE